jgi:hypothetical protein
MNYTKPKVAVLGEAVRVIEMFPLVKGTSGSDGILAQHQVVNPAYDLDE